LFCGGSEFSGIWCSGLFFFEGVCLDLCVDCLVVGVFVGVVYVVIDCVVVGDLFE